MKRDTMNWKDLNYKESLKFINEGEKVGISPEECGALLAEADFPAFDRTERLQRLTARRKILVMLSK